MQYFTFWIFSSPTAAWIQILRLPEINEELGIFMHKSGPDSSCDDCNANLTGECPYTEANLLVFNPKVEIWNGPLDEEEECLQVKGLREKHHHQAK